MLALRDIVALPIGHITAPPDHPFAGRKLFVQAFLVNHPDGVFLFDTGIGSNEEIGKELDITLRPLPEALRDAGVGIDDVRLVANCHLHFDHSGENFRFAGVPIFAQRIELDLARQPDYTLPDLVADFEGAKFEELEGEADPLPGLRIIPTPGHTAGHQALLVETAQGRVLLAGQSVNFASDWAHAEYVTRRKVDATPAPEAWMREILELDPQLVLFAHDQAVWAKNPLA
jgi:glyoxylase-like metal-dependent hydrolase (beta-lactamase superfamily II)